MAQRGEGHGGAILFFLGCYALYQNGFTENFFFLALYLLLLGIFAVRMFSVARFRLGKRAWMLAGIYAAYVAACTGLAPFNGVVALVMAVGIGLPLLFLGVASRLLHDRFEPLQRFVERNGRYLAVSAFITSPFCAWHNDLGLWPGAMLPGLWLSIACVPLVLGWRFAQPPAPREDEARFGKASDFERARVSQDF
ncbi:MAG: hypothetical protein A4S14_14675 [Proteobacteria bacterium SG_bin9]|nr:MAG: hypothetical protein A4S14_14675 [Proteobacteria bacterium SG_bin9]